MSQDSLLGQPISGFRGLDIPLNLLSAVGAMRSGQLGQLLAMQGIRRAQEQEAALQLPAQRAAYLQSPEVRQQTITEGPQGPTAQAYGLMGPRVPDDATVQRLQAAGQLDPIEAAQVQRWRQSGLEVGAPGDLPPPALTNDAADRAYKLAQANQLAAMTQALGTGGLQPPAGMVPKGWSIDPTTGKQRYDYGPAELTTLPTGTQIAPGRTAQGGEIIGSKQVAVTPGKAGAIQVGAQVSRAKSAIEQLQLMLRPDANGKRPVDIFPDMSGDGLLAMAGRTIGGRIKIPLTEGYTTGQGWLDNVRNDKQNPDAPLATTINSARGGVVNIVKGFGDAANIADAEQERLLNAFFPTLGDSPGLGGSAEGKVRAGIEQLTMIVRRLEEGQIRTPAELRAVLSEVVGSPLAAKPGALEAESGAPAPTGPATPTPDPDVDAALRRLNGGQ